LLRLARRKTAQGKVQPNEAGSLLEMNAPDSRELFAALASEPAMPPTIAARNTRWFGGKLRQPCRAGDQAYLIL